jgi:hypothetical protein
LTYAFDATCKTGKPDFFRFALINGAEPNYHGGLAQQIFESQLVSIVDCIVFGGYLLICRFSMHYREIVKHCMRAKITEEKKIEILEMFICTCGEVLLDDYEYSSDQIKEFLSGCRDLVTRSYLYHGKNSNVYKKSIEIKNRLASKMQWLIGVTKVLEKHNDVRTITENDLIELPITLIDIISEYEYKPRFKIIDWSKY